MISTRVGAVALAPVGVARAEDCPNSAVRGEQGVQEGAAHSPPACRAYELASPPLKNEEEVDQPDRSRAKSPFQAAEQGGAVEYTLDGAIPGKPLGGEQDAAISQAQAGTELGNDAAPNRTTTLEGLHGRGGARGRIRAPLSAADVRRRGDAPCRCRHSTEARRPGEQARGPRRARPEKGSRTCMSGTRRANIRW